MQQHPVTSSLLLLTLFGVVSHLGNIACAQEIPRLYRLPPIDSNARGDEKESARKVWDEPVPLVRLVSAEEDLVPIPRPVPLNDVELQGENDKAKNARRRW